MKEQLKRIYSERHAELKQIKTRFPEKKFSGPILISPNEKYNSQPFPLLVIGQETKGWVDHIDSIIDQMLVYEKFNVGINYRSSPFWNVIRKVERALGNESYSCAYTNISKFDLDGGRASGIFEAAISSVDDILLSELKILKPKVCIFFTGPSLNTRIEKIFPTVKFENFDQSICKLKHSDLPALTFKTYHPNYLRRKGLETPFLDFISGIVKT